ncbi:MAG: HAD family hydrolase, partial [Pseudomonadota bacterium]
MREQDMQDIRVITLDLDDTLWDILPVIRRAETALNDWLAEHYPRIPRRWPRERAAELRQEVLQRHADKAHDLTFLRKQVIAAMARDAGYAASLSEAAFAVFDEHRNRLELFPDARPALEKLKSRYRLIAVTNGNADLRKIGIDELFDGFVSARLAGASKPDARIFDAAVAAGGALPSETLHVGDHPDQDVGGAQRAGLRA